VHDHHDDPAFITRTRFLTGVALVTGGVMTAAILVPVVGFAAADSLKEEEWQWVDVGPLSDFPDGQTSSIAVSGPAPESDRRAFLRHKDGAMIAIWNRCAHLGCPVAYSPGGDVYACPCHGGAYDSLGLVTAGPPPRPMDRFDVKIVAADGTDIARQTTPAEGVATTGASPDARVLIGRPFSIDEDQNPYELHGPGELVTGTLSNLYPF
jgi:menaquinol-cytochrome c reductase iron-sulfur subunit